MKFESKYKMFSSWNCILKMPSGKWRPFYSVGDELIYDSEKGSLKFSNGVSVKSISFELQLFSRYTPNQQQLRSVAWLASND